MTKVNGDERKDRSHAIDSSVGHRIRMRRKELGISQETLAKELGITFQQVQKYERAANRVSASKLYEIARALQAPPSYFFEGLGDAEATPRDACTSEAEGEGEILASDEFAELARSLPKIRGVERRRLLELVRVLADKDREPS